MNVNNSQSFDASLNKGMSYFKFLTTSPFFMSTKYKAQDPDGLYFITSTVIDWVDLFTRPEYKDIIVKSLQYCIDNKGLEVFGYVIMTNHIHMIARSPTGSELSNIIRDFKSYTAKSLLAEIQRINESRREWLLAKFEYAASRLIRQTKYKIWQDGFHPIELTSGAMVEQKLQYIHNNPVVERIIDVPSHYIYSSARQYEGEKGELDICFIS